MLFARRTTADYRPDVKSLWRRSALARRILEVRVQDLNVTIPELVAVALTRGLGGVGIGLLISEYLTPSERRTVGWSLLALGALSTIPLGMRILPRAIGRSTEDQ